MIAALALLTAQPEPGPFTTELKAKAFRIRSTGPAATAKLLGRTLDAAFEIYAKVIPPHHAAAALPDVGRYASLEEFQRRSGIETDACLALVGRDGVLVGCWDPERESDGLDAYVHEGFHLYAKHRLDGSDLWPLWFSEGLAECFANAERKDGAIELTAPVGPGGTDGLLRLQRGLRGDQATPPEDLVRFGPRAFYADASLHYRQSGSFCLFLLTAPDPCRKDGGPRYAGIVAKLVAYYAAGFRIGRKPLVLSTLEKEWKDFVLALNAAAK